MSDEELVEGPLDCEEDEGEYNPRGFWLGNKETNRVFIPPGDMGCVRSLLLSAAPPTDFALEMAEKALQAAQSHDWRTAVLDVINEVIARTENRRGRT